MDHQNSEGIGIMVKAGLILSFLLASNAVAQTAEITSATPTGAVKNVQQFVVKFGTDMVAMGDAKGAKDPLQKMCTQTESETPRPRKKAAAGGATVQIPKGAGRWVDSKSWSYDFDKGLPAGIRCTFTSTSGLKDLKGQSLPVAIYSFTTGGPAIVSMSPGFSHIEPEQYFVLQLDGPMNEKSIEEHAYFETTKVLTRIGVRVLNGADREKVIRAALKADYRWQMFNEMLNAKRSFQSIKEFQNFIVVAPKGKFPEASAVVFHWTDKVLSAGGVAVTEPQKFEFQVIEAFTATFSCERTSSNRPCNPILPMRLNLSRAVAAGLLKSAKLVGPGGATWTPVEFEKQKGGTLPPETIEALTFNPPFPEKASFKIQLPAGVKDEIGRTLVNAGKFPLEVKTDEYSALVKFAAPFGILERNADPALPVSIRNVEVGLSAVKHSMAGSSVVLGVNAPYSEILRYMREVRERDSGYSYEEGGDIRGRPLLPANTPKFAIPKLTNPKGFELVGIPLKSPGLHVIEVASPKLGAAMLGGGTMYVSSAALVTNLSVHMKRGRESSIIWVTTLDKAQPAAGAEVALVDGAGKQLAVGKTDKDGIWKVGDVKLPCAWSDETRYGRECEIYAFAKQGDDFSFVGSSWSQGIESYRFNLTNEYLSRPWGPTKAHAVLDRALLQAGETLHFKVYMRDRIGAGFGAIGSDRVPKNVLIKHTGSGKTYPQKVAFDAASGTLVGEFAVPKTATLGRYEISLSLKEAVPVDESRPANSDLPPPPDMGEGEYEGDGGGQGGDYQARTVGDFVVAEYRLPLMSSNVKFVAQNSVRPTDIKLDLSAAYLSGGAAADLPVTLRASISEGYFRPTFVGSEDYAYLSAPLKTGILEHQKADADPSLAFVANQSLTLGKSGGVTTVIKGIPSIRKVVSLNVEMDYRDPNGEVKTASSSETLFPSDTIVGLKSDSWAAKAGKATVSGVVVGIDGTRLAGREYVVEGFRTEYSTHRKRILGGFYSYDSSTSVTALGKMCSGKTDAKGEFVCEAAKLPTGSVQLQARVNDSKGVATYAGVGVNVYGDGEDMWWSPSDNDRIDFLPEKANYAPTETAKLILRSPFPESKVLVTVEREGIFDAFVRDVKRGDAVIEVPLKNQYAPNVYIAALALRGRVGDPKPTALADLGRPSMKMGAAKIKVGWIGHELKVQVTPNKKKFRTREKATVTVQLTRADGEKLAPGSELAIAVVDESVMMLKKNDTVDLLGAMMGERGWSVATSSSQNQVIGKRHYGSKAKPPGGDGDDAAAPGAGQSREFFDPLLKWIPRLKVGDNGAATFEFATNDSITSFRIMVVAHSGLQFFGNASAQIQSSKDLIIYSGFAPVVREGDSIQNVLTIRNTTEKPMNVELSISSPQKIALPKPPTLVLAPNSAQEVAIPVNVPAAMKSLEFLVAAKDAGSGATDTLKVTTAVYDAVAVQVQQATLFQLDEKNQIPVQQPKDAIKDRGGIAIDARPTLLTGLSAVKAHMSEYPYSCFEQRLSKGVALEDAAAIEKLIQELPSYMDSIGLVKFFPTSSCGSVQLTRYLLELTSVTGTKIPDDSKEKMKSGLRTWVSGTVTCQNWWDQYMKNTYRDQGRVLVMDTLSRLKAFEPAWISTLPKTPNLWTTLALVSYGRMAQREANFPDRAGVIKQVENILRSRVNYQGSIMSLQNQLDWDAEWYLFSTKDHEALSLFDLAIESPGWASDIGRMARGVLARQRRGVWDSTISNAWGVAVLRKFASKFETEKVAGNTKIEAPGLVKTGPAHSIAWASKPKGEATLLSWPTGSVEKPVSIGFAHEGTGKPWIMMQTRSAIPLLKPRDLGYTVTRKVTKVGAVAGQPIQWKNGDVANVELTIVAKNTHPWVVVRDPIPAGASHLGTGLQGESSALDRGNPMAGPATGVRMWPSEFDEKSQGFFTSYAAYLPKGTYTASYRVRLNSAGAFNLPASRVEAMYSPETFGEAPIEKWTVAK